MSLDPPAQNDIPFGEPQNIAGSTLQILCGFFHIRRSVEINVAVKLNIKYRAQI